MQQRGNLNGSFSAILAGGGICEGGGRSPPSFLERTRLIILELFWGHFYLMFLWYIYFITSYSMHKLANQKPRSEHVVPASPTSNARSVWLTDCWTNHCLLKSTGSKIEKSWYQYCKKWRLNCLHFIGTRGNRFLLFIFIHVNACGSPNVFLMSQTCSF